jgi:hypothetical protein
MKTRKITFDTRKPRLTWVRKGKHYQGDPISVGGKLLFQCVTHRLGTS